MPPYWKELQAEPEPSTPAEAFAVAQKYEALFWEWYLLERKGYTDRAHFAREKAKKLQLYLKRFYLLPAGIAVSGRVLDVGCGVISLLESQPGIDALAIDPNLSRYHELIPEFAVLGQVGNCFYRSCLIQDVEETGFDAVWSHNVLSHTVNWRDIVFHMHRVLRIGGLLLLGANVMNRPPSRQRRVCHPAVIQAEDLLSHVAECGFEIGGHTPVTLEPQRYMMAIWARKT